MSRAISIYLDLMRATAALLVVLFHASFERLGGAWLQPAFGRTGTPGVIMFFVLSGFVIAWTAATRERDFQVYIVNRLARLWSVAIPALLLTAVVDAFGRATFPSIYPTFYLVSYPIERLAIASMFLNQIWFLNVQPLSNGPFWSLCYEWWYYVVFGCIVLIQGPKRWVFAILALAVMGPKLWLLFPVWLMGVLVWRWSDKSRQLPKIAALALFLAPLALIAIFALDDALHFNDRVEAVVGHRLGYSNMFVQGTLFGLLVAMNIFAFPVFERYFEPMLSRAEVPIRWIAGATLSIYLFHFPLLHFFGALVRLEPSSSPWKSATVLTATLACCLALSRVTESKKRAVRGWLTALLGLVPYSRRSPSASPISKPAPKVS